MSDIKRRLRALEQKRAKGAKPAWRTVHVCTVDNRWCVSDADGIRYGQGDPPERLPGDAWFITNIPVDAI